MSDMGRYLARLASRVQAGPAVPVRPRAPRDPAEPAQVLTAAPAPAASDGGTPHPGAGPRRPARAQALPSVDTSHPLPPPAPEPNGPTAAAEPSPAITLHDASAAPAQSRAVLAPARPPAAGALRPRPALPASTSLRASVQAATTAPPLCSAPTGPEAPVAHPAVGSAAVSRPQAMPGQWAPPTPAPRPASGTTRPAAQVAQAEPPPLQVNAPHAASPRTPSRSAGPAPLELHIGRIQLSVRSPAPPPRPAPRTEARPDRLPRDEAPAFSSHRHYLRGL